MSNNDLISRDALKAKCIRCSSEWCSKENRYCKTCSSAIVTREMIDNAPTVERPKTDILEQIIAEINSSNRGTCDYYIVDRIEEIINEYQKGGAE